ncbi:MAG: phosphopantetheine-binding protein [Actinomycetota bacterium]
MDPTLTIKQFIVEEFLPDVSPDQLDSDYDLLANGVIDSLGLLKMIAWIEDRFQLAVDDLDLAPERFSTVDEIRLLIADAMSQRGSK